MNTISAIAATAIRMHISVARLFASAAALFAALSAALAAYLAVLQHKSLLLSYRELSGYLEHIVSLGCIDGVTKKSEPSVDGFPPDIEREILGTLYLISSAAS